MTRASGWPMQRPARIFFVWLGLARKPPANLRLAVDIDPQSFL
ncbi:hypothetical protein ATH84_1001316 [Paracoccus versutus]|uniref:Uncharacterized protein n=1 Tax=Paracoccus versutus TaxID=34007 RepID=A0AAQ0KNU5_PARVE|nr:hypothetical protein [Paracoccus versutus]REG57267.1 hypothetical protein ATH84_1001316 [Paracoccus versutus]